MNVTTIMLTITALATVAIAFTPIIRALTSDDRSQRLKTLRIIGVVIFWTIIIFQPVNWVLLLASGAPQNSAIALGVAILAPITWSLLMFTHVVFNVIKKEIIKMHPTKDDIEHEKPMGMSD